MALQTSGAISLNQIHVEAGGTSGTTVSLNDSDVRGLTAASGYTINATSGTTISIGDFYGASAVSSLTVTQGSNGSVKGYRTTGSGTTSPFGSITPSNFTVNGVSLTGIYYTEFTIKSSTSRIFFIYLQGTRAKSFFTSASVTGIGTLATSSSGHAQSSSGSTGHPYTYWSWNLSSTPSVWDGTGDITGITFT